MSSIRKQHNAHYDKYKRNQEAKRFYGSKAWLQCRDFVLRRDNYLCQLCLRNGVLQAADIVHHIEHLQDNLERALDPDNLESVCPSCHNELHPEKGFSVQKKQHSKKKSKIRVIMAKANKDEY